MVTVKLMLGLSFDGFLVFLQYLNRISTRDLYRVTANRMLSAGNILLSFIMAILKAVYGVYSIVLPSKLPEFHPELEKIFHQAGLFFL